MTTEKTETRTALPVRPMNAGQEPASYPLASPASLSPDAQHVYLHGRGQRLDRDLFDPSLRNRFVSREEGAAFKPTERMLAAIAELETARLATYSETYGPQLRVTRVHEQYTYAQGRGAQLIKVSVFEQYPEESQLLAVLIGGDLESRDSRGSVAEVEVRARHENATDFEHDASSTALMVVRNLSQPTFMGYGHMSFTAVLTSAHLYPIGVDPLLADDGDTNPSQICTDCEECHPMAPHLPPKVTSLSGAHFVTVEVRPFRPYLVETPPLFDKASRP